jgi:acetyl esterase/lipase
LLVYFHGGGFVIGDLDVYDQVCRMLCRHAAGVPVVLRRFDGLIHGFINMTGVSRASRDALIEVAGALRALVHVSETAKEHSEPIRPGR